MPQYSTKAFTITKSDLCTEALCSYFIIFDRVSKNSHVPSLSLAYSQVVLSENQYFLDIAMHNTRIQPSLKSNLECLN